MTNYTPLSESELEGLKALVNAAEALSGEPQIEFRRLFATIKSLITQNLNLQKKIEGLLDECALNTGSVKQTRGKRR